MLQVSPLLVFRPSLSAKVRFKVVCLNASPRGSGQDDGNHRLPRPTW